MFAKSPFISQIAPHDGVRMLLLPGGSVLARGSDGGTVYSQDKTLISNLNFSKAKVATNSRMAAPTPRGGLKKHLAGLLKLSPITY